MRHARKSVKLISILYICVNISQIYNIDINFRYLIAIFFPDLTLFSEYFICL